MGSDRDYYADLELPPTADIPEIKKQFRKLALKYHPDRNPGRETEVNAQFQIIQSAHEILGDPQSKAKYDASLPRSRFPGASGVKGNPWSHVGEQFPAPPRRTPGGARRTAPPPPPPQPTGAQRWQSRFASGTAPTAKQTSANDPQLKKNAAKAFEQMRKNPGASGTSPTRPRPMSSQPPPMPPRNEPPRTEFARQRREASFGNRRTGYQPGDRSGEDEPPVTRHSYNSPAKPPRPPKEPMEPPEEQPTPIPDPLAQFREPISPLDPRPSMPYAKLGGETIRTNDGTSPARAKSAREPGHRTENSSSDDRSSSQHNARRSSSLPRPGGTDRLGDDMNAEGGRPHSSETPTDGYDRSSFKSRSNAANVAGGSKSADEAATTDGDGQKQHSIFTMPVDGKTFRQTSPEPKPFTRRSTEEIDTSFVDEDDSQNWQFSAGGERPRAQPKRRLQPEGPEAPATNPSVPQTETATTQPQNTNPENAFNPGGWSDQFGPQIFVPQRDQTSSASPTRTNRKNSRKTKTAAMKGTTAASAVIIDSSSDDDGLAQWPGRKPPKASDMDSPQAMDLDSPPAKPTNPPPASHTARNIPVEPTRPEWRQGNVEDTNGEPKPAPVPNAAPGLGAQGSEDTDEFRASFSDLRNVAPFANTKSGLKSFDDLKDNLPFESKASSDATITLPPVRPLNFPNPPNAPRPPPTAAISGMRPNVASWKRYLEDFEKYLRAWDDWNATVSNHFGERKRLIRDARAKAGYDFLGIRGDTDVVEYYSWVQQDNDVRRRWCAACEEHEQRMREFIAFREKMK
ncbi:hypothetical protein NLU13_0533 [Sarocladium strictum]|uniref:J domain-containing protein n=1 Tax=Sarocladium strictum TaxID=5046 RepID=A0AA39GPZ9_SARSR|nr:hypothetical protein NLU13_0533 [Sarocladium strictum]